MKNIIKIASVAAVALAMTQTLQAVPITGSVTFDGTVQLGNAGNPVSSVASATEVLNWYGNNGAGNPYVASSSGSLAAASFQPVTFATPWTFGTQSSLWSYLASNGDTFTFSLTHINSDTVSGSPAALTITGSGTITATGPVAFDATGGTWAFSTQDPESGGVFSFSAASGSVPDGGATAMMLGLALSGIALLKKKLTA